MDESDNRVKMERKKRFPRAEKKVEKSTPLGKKERILSSKMPEWHKKQYLKELGYFDSGSEEKGKVSFKVYTRLRNIGDNFHGAMLAFPPAKNKELETPGKWDQIFKKF